MGAIASVIGASVIAILIGLGIYFLINKASEVLSKPKQDGDK